MNTNMTGFGFQKSLRPSALDESSISTGRASSELLKKTLSATLILCKVTWDLSESSQNI